ncbi:MAG: hypothetical protein ACTSWM_08200, partial [Alphaproteobacteria bacterium]
PRNLVMNRDRLSLLFGAAALFCVGAMAPASAMPVEQNYYAAPGVTADGRLDIRDVPDNATQMEMHLTQQVLVLQDQIDQLREELEALKAATTN